MPVLTMHALILSIRVPALKLSSGSWKQSPRAVWIGEFAYSWELWDGIYLVRFVILVARELPLEHRHIILISYSHF